MTTPSTTMAAAVPHGASTTPSTLGTPAAIEVTSLSRQFVIGGRRKQRIVPAVSNVSFTIAAGERVAFIGPNGAGKSTTIKMMTGILTPSAGSISVLGFSPASQRRELSRYIGSLFGQRSQLWSELSARRSYQMLGAIFGLSRAETAERIDRLSAQCDAADLIDAPVRSLSLGQRMRCELLATLLHHPSVLFLDEPTIGLDLVAKQRFRELLITLNDELSTTIVLTSHDAADIEHVAQRVIVINHGRVMFDGTQAELRTHAPRPDARDALEAAITGLYQSGDSGAPTTADLESSPDHRGRSR